MATRKDRRSDRPPLEESYHGERSSVPCTGDTLPWNLSKHQRVKRSKSASGEVLDPAERAVIRIAGRTTMKSTLMKIVFFYKGVFTDSALAGELTSSSQSLTLSLVHTVSESRCLQHLRLIVASD